jgi:mutator protein MutT
VLVDGDRVLMCHRHPDRQWYPNIWDLPGGHIEPGEQPHEALVRELEEELGIVVDLPAIEPSRTLTPEAGLTIHVWVIRSWSGEVCNRAWHEHDSIGWFRAGEVAELDLPDRVLVDVCRDALA